MAGYSLSDIRSLPDLLAPNRFKFEIPAIPGYGVNRKLGIKCSRTVLPGGEVGRLTKNIAGIKSHHHGQFSYGSDDMLSVSYVEDVEMNTYKTLKKWLALVQQYEANLSIDKLIYSTIGYLRIYDQKDREIESFTFFNLFPVVISPIQFAGDIAQVATVDVSFSFDSME